MKLFNIISQTRLFVIVIFTALFLGACTDAPNPTKNNPPEPSIDVAGNEQTNPVVSDVKQDGYPAPKDSSADAAYPIVQAEPTSFLSAYPPPASEEVFQEPRFRLDLPQQAGGTAVTGQSPPGLPLAIVDITLNGIILGSGVSDDNGRFNINTQPLPEGHRIGITFASLEPGKSYNDMSNEYFPYRGENFMNLPNVGIFFDTTLVE